jgi:hypothetical protein
LIVAWSIADQYYWISNISVHNCVRSVNTMTPCNIKTSTCRTNICWIWTVFYMLLLIQHNNNKKQKNPYTIKSVSCDQDLSERGSAGTSVRGPEKPERDLWISEWPNSLSHRRFILIVFHSLGYVQLFLDMLSGHSAAQEIKHLWKLSSGFIEPQILNFERSLSLFPGPQISLVPPCKIYLGRPCMWSSNGM